ncbi:hypothetical protein Tco_0830234 [Tanacetum coccineum]
MKTQVVNCTKINLENKSVNDTLTVELERYKEQVKVLKEGQNVDLESKYNISDSCAQSVEIDHLKQTLSKHLKEKESLVQTVTLLKNDFKKEESRNINREIALEKRIKQLDNIVFKRYQSAQYCSLDNETSVFHDQYHLYQALAQSQEKNSIIKKLKKRIKSVSGKQNEDKIKKDLEEIETINIELDHREKVLVITALKDDLRKLKGKSLVDNDTVTGNIVSTQEEATILRDLVEHVKLKYPLDQSLESACRYWGLQAAPSIYPKDSLKLQPYFVIKFLGTGSNSKNEHVANILGMVNYRMGECYSISRVYYVEGLGHNLFSVRKFCDSNLEVAFRQHTCFIRNLEGVDLLTGSRGNNLYTLSLGDMMASSPICLLSKASKTKSWLWHRRLSI